MTNRVLYLRAGDSFIEQLIYVQVAVGDSLTCCTQDARSILLLNNENWLSSCEANITLLQCDFCLKMIRRLKCNTFVTIARVRKNLKLKQATTTLMPTMALTDWIVCS